MSAGSSSPASTRTTGSSGPSFLWGKHSIFKTSSFGTSYHYWFGKSYTTIGLVKATTIGLVKATTIGQLKQPARLVKASSGLTFNF